MSLVDSLMTKEMTRVAGTSASNSKPDLSSSSPTTFIHAWAASGNTAHLNGTASPSSLEG
jgi:hypothetical protein